MSTKLMNLPINIPWKLIAASPDMLDTKFCNKRFPFAWRSSLAISVYEPKLEDLPEELCDERLTYLKVTCSITGYQPSEEETEQANKDLLGSANFSHIPDEQLERVMSEYFACYGVLLNVAVFPTPSMDATINKHCIPFDALKKGGSYPNPFSIGDVTIAAKDRPENRTVDNYPSGGGDGKPELDLAKEMTIKFPTAVKVTAKVVHYSRAVTLQAYRGDQMVGSQTTGDERDTLHELVIEHDEIDRVEFISPQNEAYLVEFCYYVRTVRPRGIALKDLPRIIDFEPKKRDLYQAATETGEILSASGSSIKTDKSFTRTEDSETGIAGTYRSPMTTYGQAEVSLSHKWGHTDADAYTTQTDASRERRESQSTTTNLSQMYNLLTGYHPGTNRAVFLMLPRPHVLQPTDRRTFIQGLRHIEGVQDFFLIVTRHKDIDSMCVEAFLETGHFPSDYRPPEPPIEYEGSYEDFVVTAYAQDKFWSNVTVNIHDDPSSTYTVQDGWIIDRRPGKGDSGHRGIEEGADSSNQQAKDTLSSYNYQATDTSVQVSGKITASNAPTRHAARFERNYRVLTRSEEPIPSTALLPTPFFLTSRGLCTCFQWENNCPKVLSVSAPGHKGSQWDSIVHESKIQIDGALLTKDMISQSRMPAMKELLRNIQSEMATSWRRPNRRAFGEVGFLESDYFKERIKTLLPKEVLGRALRDIEDLSPSFVKGLGEDCTIDDVLKLDLQSLMRKTGLAAREVAHARRTLLGIKPRPEAPAADVQHEPDSPKQSDE